MINLFKTLFVTSLIVLLLFLFSKLEKSHNDNRINEIVILSDLCYSDNFVSDILKKMKQKLDTLKLKDIVLNNIEISLLN